MRYAQIRKTDIANGEGIKGFLYMFKDVTVIVLIVLIKKHGIFVVVKSLMSILKIL